MFDDCEIACLDGRADSYGIYLDYADVSVVNSRILGFDQPLRGNGTFASSTFVFDKYNLFSERVSACNGNHFQMKSTGLRLLDWNPFVFNATNSFEFYENYAGTWNQSSYYTFKPSRIVALPFSWTPATSQSNTAVTLSTVVDGLLDTTKYKFLVLGWKGKWTTPASDSINVRLEVRKGSSSRGVFSSNADSSTAMFLDDGTAYDSTGERWLSTGTGHVFVDPEIGEYLRLVYYSGASAGGPIDVIVYALVEEGTNFNS
jgi:hypothetical protein